MHSYTTNLELFDVFIKCLNYYIKVLLYIGSCVVPYSPKFSQAINFAFFAKTDRPRKFYCEIVEFCQNAKILPAKI